MTEKPIIFSAEMVRAILDGRKTQTRRMVKPQPVLRDGNDPCWSWRYGEKNPPQLSRWFDVERFGDALSCYCPYKPGDRLWASRITLEVVGVRAERLQKITDMDAIAEGVAQVGGIDRTGLTTGETVLVFRELWDSINAGRGYSWESNPWVWAVEFRRVL